MTRRIKDRVTQKFKVAIAEVASRDDWQKAVLGFAIVANDKAFVASVVDKVLAFIEEVAEAKLVDDEKDFVVHGRRAARRGGARGRSGLLGLGPSRR